MAWGAIGGMWGWRGIYDAMLSSAGSVTSETSLPIVLSELDYRAEAPQLGAFGLTLLKRLSASVRHADIPLYDDVVWLVIKLWLRKHGEVRISCRWSYMHSIAN